MQNAWLCLLLAACGGGDGAEPDAAAAPGDTAAAADACVTPAPFTADCGAGAGCTPLAVAGDPISPGPGAFHGFADPGLAADPAVAHRIWLAYSWPHLATATGANNAQVTLAAVGTHLAKSDDGGATFTYSGPLFADTTGADPGGSGEQGRLSAETASLASITSGSTTTWYGTHLHYFLRPLDGYNPNYATGWTVQIAAASSPADLGTAASVTLGVTATSAGYGAMVHLDALAGMPQASCAMLNNPAIFAKDGALYLVVECLAFAGSALQPGATTVHVFRTTPAGAPASWTWTHAGEVAGADLIAQLGADTIQQPELSLAADGTPLLVVSPAHDDPTTAVGTVPDGCVALELASLDPPVLAQDCAGHAKIRARVTGTGYGACSQVAGSASGILAVSQTAGGNWQLRASGAKP